MGNIFTVSLSCDAFLLRCLDCICGEVVVMSQMEDKLAELEREKVELIEIEHEVQRRVNDEKGRQGRHRLVTVGGWLSRVEAIIPEIDHLLSLGEQEVKRLCFGGRLSRNCKSSIKFGKLVSNKLEEVVNLKAEGLNFGQVTTTAEVVLERPCGPKVGLESTLEKVCSCIREERWERIGLYGLGGVGKTTLLKQINNNFAGLSKDFDAVIWVVVSQNFVLDKVQDQIWKQIRSPPDDQWKSQSTGDKAVDIFNVLRKKKFLLLLDDLWKPIDFEKVGVPLKQKWSQVIFTTRSMTVCHQMEAQLIKVEPLQWPEAWALFQEKVGRDTLTSDERIAPLAESVAKKCGGLPIALITVGRAMAGKKAWQAWEHAIKVITKATSSLQHMDDEELFQDVKKEVLALLKYSYDSLSNDMVKSCFLYCTLFPEDYRIGKRMLIDLWICETFWGGYDDLTEDRNKGYDILDFLIRSCLIEEEGNIVKMHDVIREMALWITHKSKERKETFLVQAGVGLEKAPAIEKWEGISRMSLMRNSIVEVEAVPTCPDILTLFLCRNFSLKKLPDGFFQSMKALTVLDLSFTALRKLPSGLSALVSLQYLRLNGTKIEELPLELQELEKLKHLDVNSCRQLTKIPKQVILGLASLKVLKLQKCNEDNSCVEAEGNILLGGEVLMEILLYLQGVVSELSVSIRSQSALENISSKCRSLSHVVALCLEGFNVPLIFDISCLGSAEHLGELSFEGLKGVEEMTVGLPMKWIESQGPDSPHGSAIANTKVCFKSLTRVYLLDCDDLQHLTWVAQVPNLSVLLIQFCKSLKEVISEDKLNDVMHPFAKLEFLFINVVPELKSIFQNPLPFPALRSIVVDRCPMLKKLPLNSESAKGCKLVIEGSDEWWQGVEWEDDAAKHVFQPSFKRHPWEA